MMQQHVDETTLLVPLSSSQVVSLASSSEVCRDHANAVLLQYWNKRIALTAFATFVVIMTLVFSLLVQTTTRHHAPLNEVIEFVPSIHSQEQQLGKGGGDTSRRRRPHAIELAQFSLLDGVAIDDFVTHAQALQTFFESSDDAVSRSLVLNQATGEWSDIVYWTTMSAALQAAQDIMNDATAQPFLKSINSTTLRLNHATIALDWVPAELTSEGEAAPVVEIAAFPLVPDRTDTNFVKSAEETTPFFEFVGTAKRRILAEGDDNTTWYDFVYWTSLSAALIAAKAIERVPSARAFLDSIDSTSSIFQFQYSSIMLGQEFQ